MSNSAKSLLGYIIGTIALSITVYLHNPKAALVPIAIAGLFYGCAKMIQFMVEGD